MIRLHALVEGQTEERFFKDVIAPHLAGFGIFASVSMLTSKQGRSARSDKGGWTSFHKARRELDIFRRSQPDTWFTTMVDFYAIPADFPCLDEARRHPDPYARAARLEQAWADSFAETDFRRFVPYIQLHEFEALVLADPQKLDWEFLEHDPAIARLVALMEGQQPERIDDGRETAPSKRIIAEIPQYDGRKASAGPAVAARIGLATLRARCPHFHTWLTALEALAPQDPTP